MENSSTMRRRGFGRQIKMEGNRWQTSINVDNWGDAASRVLFLSDAGPRCNLREWSKRKKPPAFHQPSAPRWESVRSGGGRAFVPFSCRPAGAIHGARLAVPHEVNSGSRCTGGALARNRTWVSRVSNRWCIEIRGFQIRIYFASWGNATDPCAFSGRHPSFILVSAVVLRVCPCHCMSTPGGQVIRRNISPIRVGETHRNNGWVDRALYEENGKRKSALGESEH